MTKFTDKYFRDKAQEIYSTLGLHPSNDVGNEIDNICITLKEVHNKTKEACTKIESDLCLPPIKSEDFVTGISDGESEYQYELGRRDGYDEGIIAHINKCKNI
jgi:hypothetical protein